MVVRSAFVALALALSLPGVWAQDTQDPYDNRYGAPVDVTVTDLVQNGQSYEGRAVRTRSQVYFDSTQGQRLYFFQDFSGTRVYLNPVPEASGNWDFESMRIVGSDIEITGLFASSNSGAQGFNTAAGVITFWKFVEAPREADLKKSLADAVTVTLESLVSRPGKQDGRTVRVVGQFRGRNLFGDLPSSSQKGHSDWVIKDDLFAVWVTGKKPKGDGIDLDPSLKRDSGHWVEVIGKVQSHGPIVYIEALKVMEPLPSPMRASRRPLSQRSPRCHPWSCSSCRLTETPRSRNAPALWSSSARTWTRAASRGTSYCATRAASCPGNGISTVSR